MTTTKQAERVIENRVKIAHRWHALKRKEEVAAFVLADPAVQALEADAAVKEEVVRDLITRVVVALREGDDVALAKLRTMLGDEMFERIIALAQQAAERGC
jgi:hypothetical protein